MKHVWSYFWLIIIFGNPFLSVSQNSVITSGSDAVGSGGSSSYSVGQIVFQKKNSENASVAEGNQQPIEFMVLSNENFEAIQLAIIVSPNPTNSNLHLIFSNDFTIENTSYELFDLNGKIIKKKTVVTTLDELIDLTNLAVGHYLLYVSKENKNLKSFKIIKN